MDLPEDNFDDKDFPGPPSHPNDDLQPVKLPKELQEPPIAPQNANHVPPNQYIVIPHRFANFVPKPSLMRYKLIAIAIIILLVSIVASGAIYSALGIHSPAWMCARSFASTRCLHILYRLNMGDIHSLVHERHDGRSILEFAVETENLELWNFLVNTLGAQANNMLDWACRNNNTLANVRWLVTVTKVSVTETVLNFTDPIYENNVRYTTLLGVAAFYGRIDVVEWALNEDVLPINAKDRLGKAMHFNAVMGGQLDVLKWIHSSFPSSCDSSADYTLDCENGRRYFDLAEKDYAGFTIAHSAAYLGNYDILNWIDSEESGLERLITSKTNLNESILHWAIAGANPEFVEHMLGKYIKRLLWNDVDGEGWNIVHFAAKRGDPSILNVLKRHVHRLHPSLFFNAGRHGITPFLACSMSNKTSGLSWFAGEFENIAVRSSAQSGTHIAAMYGNLAPLMWYARVAPATLELVAQSSKKTPLEVAKLHCRYEAVDYIRDQIGRDRKDTDEWMQKCPRRGK